MVRRLRVNSHRPPKQSRRCANPCGGETRPISHSSRHSLAWSANAHRVMRIISNLRNPEHSDARLAMNSPCHYAGNIIATCTAMATKSRGGQTSRLHRSRRQKSFGKQPCLNRTGPINPKDRVSHTMMRCGCRINRSVHSEAKRITIQIGEGARVEFQEQSNGHRELRLAYCTN
jgi:hypothetical protein